MLLGQEQLRVTQKQNIIEKRKKESDFFEAFSVIDPEIEIDKQQINTSQDVILYLWTTNEDCYKTYAIIRLYLLENYSIDSNILLAVIKDNNYSMTKMLSNIPYIHSGYVNTILPVESNAE